MKKWCYIIVIVIIIKPSQKGLKMCGTCIEKIERLSEKFSILELSKKMNIPYSSLQNKRKGYTSITDKDAVLIDEMYDKYINNNEE